MVFSLWLFSVDSLGQNDYLSPEGEACAETNFESKATRFDLTGL
jgi:hypothetical protein